MATRIADTACVDARAELDDHVEIGPFCVIGPEVKIGRGTRLVGHCVVSGCTTLGSDNVVAPFTVLGGDSDSRSRQRPRGRLEIGDGNVFRESVTIAAGSPEATTRIGDRGHYGAQVLIERDCRIGSEVLLGPTALLAEEVFVGAGATISAAATIHRRVTIGTLGFVGARALVRHDVPPFLLVDGQPALVKGLNLAGLKRAGLDKGRMESIREAHRLLYRAHMEIDEARKLLDARGHRTTEVEELLNFILAMRSGRHGRARGSAKQVDLLPK